jgi:CHAT domain-containing protein
MNTTPVSLRQPDPSEAWAQFVKLYTPMFRSRAVLLVVWALSAPLALAQDGGKEPIIHEVGKDGLEIAGKLTGERPPPLGRTALSEPHQAFWLKLQGGRPYVLDLQSKDFEPVLVVQDAKGNVLAHNLGDLTGRLLFRPTQDATYRVAAATEDRYLGAFVLRVQQREFSAEEKQAAEAFRLNREGVALFKGGQIAEALKSYRQAAALLEKAYPVKDFPDGHRLVASNLSNVAAALHALGQPLQALPYAERALAMDEKLYPEERFPGGHLSLWYSLNNLAPILLDLGQPGKALPHLERALAIIEKQFPAAKHPDGTIEVATSLAHLGHALMILGQPAKAEPYLKRALAMNEKLYPAERFPNGHPDLAVSISSVADVLPPREALPYHERALAMLKKVYPPERYPNGHRDLATALRTLGQVHRTLGETGEALECYEQALAMREKLYPDGDPMLVGSLSALGRLLDSMGQSAKALGYCERSLAMTRQATMRLALLRSEAEALDYLQGLAETRDYFLSLALASPERMPPEQVYARLWESKAMLTRVVQARRHATRIALGSDDKLKQTWLELLDVSRRLAGLRLKPVTDPKIRDDNLRKLTERKEQLETAIAGMVPEIGRDKQSAGLGPEDLANRLDKDAVFLDFVRYRYWQKGKKLDLRYVVFVLTPGKAVQMIELGEAGPIDEAILAWRTAIDRDEVSAAPGVLAKLFWQKIAVKIPEKTQTLFLAPDGDLARLPFAALPGKQPGSVLLEDYRPASVPHGPFLLDQLRQPPTFPRGPGTLLTLGGVQYHPPGSKPKQPWPALPGTEREARQIQALDPRREVINLTGTAATTGRVLQELPGARYAHLATHGFFEETLLTEERRRQQQALDRWEPGTNSGRIGLGARHPLGYTGLVLAADGKTGAEAGVVTGESLIELPLDGLRLAVLSACETGLGDLTEGEGVAGLQRAFHLAGCANVVASLWKVNDAATAALMTKFYHELWVENKTPLAALREAQLTIYHHPELIPSLAGDRGRPEQQKAVQLGHPVKLPADTPAGTVSAPRKWAAFVLSGVGQ